MADAKKIHQLKIKWNAAISFAALLPRARNSFLDLNLIIRFFDQYRRYKCILHFNGNAMSVSGQYWIFLGAVSGLLAVIAGAIGAHALPAAAGNPVYHTGQLYHALHSLALIGVGLTLLHVDGRQGGFTKGALQLAALAFTVGIVCFSGGIYIQVAKGFTSSAGIVPFGGMSFMLGWAAFAIGAL